MITGIRTVHINLRERERDRETERLRETKRDRETERDREITRCNYQYCHTLHGIETINLVCTHVCTSIIPSHHFKVLCLLY